MYLEDRTVRLQLWDTAGQEYVSSAIADTAGFHLFTGTGVSEV